MRIPLQIFGLVTLALVIGACSPPAGESARSRAAQAASDFTVDDIVIPVEVAHPMRGDISAYFETTTRVEAERRVEVTSEGMGVCMAVFADEGDTIEKRHILAELDKEEAQASLAQARVTENERRTAYERAKRAFDAGILAEQDRDAAQFAYENALATRRLQEVQLANLTIRAPISGVVTHRHIQPGMLVSTGTPVFTLVDPSSYQLVINPPEKNLMQLREGQVARFTVDAIAGEEFDARISRINPSVDPTSGTVKVVLSLDRETQDRLREAAFTRVRLVMQTREETLLLPKDAVIEENARTYVFVARLLEETQPEEPLAGETATPDEDAEAVSEQGAEETGAAAPEPEAAESATSYWVAERVEVELGLEDSDNFEITSGLDENDLVITLGQLALRPGARISITTTDAELAKNTRLSAEEALAAARTARQKRADVGTPRRRRGFP